MFAIGFVADYSESADFFRCNSEIVATPRLVPLKESASEFVPPSADSFQMSFFYFSSLLLCHTPSPQRQVNNSRLLCTINNEHNILCVNK